MDNPTVTIVDGRSCEGCTMCCKLLAIEELEKPRLKWCSHCDVGIGCKIYADRPSECRDFHCGYLLDALLDEHWKPSKSKMMLVYETDPSRVMVHVDPGRLDAWRKEPYYTELKRWAAVAYQRQGQVIVAQGGEAIAILPDRDKNLGPVREDQVVVSLERNGPTGMEYDVVVVDQDHPLAQQIQA